MDNEKEVLKETREELNEEVSKEMLENNNKEIVQEEKEEVLQNKENENTQESKAETEQTSEEVIHEEIQEEKCLNCGAVLQDDEEFCSKCGIKRGTTKKVVCKKCGAELEIGKKYCTKCGEKVEVTIDNVVDSVKQKYKESTQKIDKNKIKKLVIILVVAIILIFIGIKVAPKIFVSTETLLEQGEYEKAYKKAKGNEKQKIANENLIAVLCKDVIEAYKDPSSFDLRDAWIDTDKKVVVMKTGGKNSYGGIVFSYDYFTYDEKENKYEYYCSLSSLQKEEYSRYDDYDESLEKILKNAARSVVSEVIKKDKYKLSNDNIKNINNLFKQDLLDSIQLLNVNAQANI